MIKFSQSNKIRLTKKSRYLEYLTYVFVLYIQSIDGFEGSLHLNKIFLKNADCNSGITWYVNYRSY